MKIYEVGGAVRDKLMHISPHDTDYVVIGASVAQMFELGFRQVGKGFPVFINPQNGCEYALARKEIKTGPGHTDFHFIFDASVTLAEDLERRDFTCNALAQDTETGEIIDFHGGREDIKNKTLRHINSLHFPEDPLRVLRLCRFAAQLNFKPAEETLRLARQMVADGMLSNLSAERVWQEINKALQTPNFNKFIATAQNCGALEAILPEISARTKADKHLLSSLHKTESASPVAKFAIMMLAVKNTQPQLSNSTTIISQICARLKVPNRYKKFALFCCRFCPFFQTAHDIPLAQLAELTLALLKQIPEDLANFSAVCQTDFNIRRSNSNAKKAVFKQNMQKLRTAVKILSAVKASDMPDFSKLAKDKSFARHYRAYQIDILKQNIK